MRTLADEQLLVVATSITHNSLGLLVWGLVGLCCPCPRLLPVHPVHTNAETYPRYEHVFFVWLNIGRPYLPPPGGLRPSPMRPSNGAPLNGPKKSSRGSKISNGRANDVSAVYRAPSIGRRWIQCILMYSKRRIDEFMMHGK